MSNSNDCLLHSLDQLFINNTRHIYSETVLALNIILLLYFLIELQFIRKVKWCKLQHAFLTVLLSNICAVISSTFFTVSETADNDPTICQFAPIIAIVCRTLSKTCTWAFYVIRGQMVMESLNSRWLPLIAKRAPYLLVLQCVTIVCLIVFFTTTTVVDGHCTVHYPLWLLLSSMVLGEVFYGVFFMRIFYKAMTTSMEHVYNSLCKAEVKETKRQIWHHLVVYTIQLLISLIFLIIVSLCICLSTLIFFEAELLLSNLCLVLLFRHKRKLWKQVLCKCCRLHPPERAMAHHLSMSPVKSSSTRAIAAAAGRTRDVSRFEHPHYSMRQISFRDLKQMFVAQPSLQSNYLLSNKWRTKKEMVNIKHAINSANMSDQCGGGGVAGQHPSTETQGKTTVRPVLRPMQKSYSATDCKAAANHANAARHQPPRKSLRVPDELNGSLKSRMSTLVANFSSMSNSKNSNKSDVDMSNEQQSANRNHLMQEDFATVSPFETTSPNDAACVDTNSYRICAMHMIEENMGHTATANHIDQLQSLSDPIVSIDHNASHVSDKVRRGTYDAAYHTQLSAVKKLQTNLKIPQSRQ